MTKILYSIDKPGILSKIDYEESLNDKISIQLNEPAMKCQQQKSTDNISNKRHAQIGILCPNDVSFNVAM
ncbi:unnamed protein product [Rotaria socialis]